jgi:hypothetical protein
MESRSRASEEHGSLLVLQPDWAVKSGVNGKLIKKVATRIPHDFRRSAVRNLERAGVSRSSAMKMVGHRTQAIYDRYAIADEASLREAGEKLAALRD